MASERERAIEAIKEIALGNDNAAEHALDAITAHVLEEMRNASGRPDPYADDAASIGGGARLTGDGRAPAHSAPQGVSEDCGTNSDVLKLAREVLQERLHPTHWWSVSAIHLAREVMRLHAVDAECRARRVAEARLGEALESERARAEAAERARSKAECELLEYIAANEPESMSSASDTRAESAALERDDAQRETSGD